MLKDVNMNTTILRICNKCGWAHFPQTRAQVEEQAKSFGEYINSQPPEVQVSFGYGPLSKTGRVWAYTEHVSHSEHCFNCGEDYTNFRDLNENDRISDGVTLQGIIKP